MISTFLFTTIVTAMLNLQNSAGTQPHIHDVTAPPKGYVQGKVVDTKGQPMKGVDIIIDNTLFYNANLLTTSKEDGTYSIKLLRGTWQAYAEMRKTFLGKTYKIDLEPNSADGFSQEEAVTRNFQWKLTGKKPLPLQGYYGGTITINGTPSSMLPEPENIEFTLVPVGSLIDGSQGKTLVLTPGKPRTDSYGKLVDIPIGLYKVSAIYKTTGQRLKLGTTTDYAEKLQDSVEVLFEPMSELGANSAFIKYSETGR